jgi:hypothetical protein
MPEPVPVFIEVRNPFPNLIFARKNKRLRVVKISDLDFLPENTINIFKRMMLWWNTQCPGR